MENVDTSHTSVVVKLFVAVSVVYFAALVVYHLVRILNVSFGIAVASAGDRLISTRSSRLYGQ